MLRGTLAHWFLPLLPLQPQAMLLVLLDSPLALPKHRSCLQPAPRPLRLRIRL